jgi:hypothetical protein
MLTLILIFVLVFFGLMVFYIFCYWRIYTKAGQAGWKCLIPIYNVLISLDIAKQPRIWLLYMFIPIVNIYFAVKHIHGLSLAFGKDVGFTVGMILLPVVFIPVLALGSAEYQYNKTEDGLIHELHDAN